MVSHKANPAHKAAKAARDGADSRRKVTKNNSDARRAQNRKASRAYRSSIFPLQHLAQSPN